MSVQLKQVMASTVGYLDSLATEKAGGFARRLEHELDVLHTPVVGLPDEDPNLPQPERPAQTVSADVAACALSYLSWGVGFIEGSNTGIGALDQLRKAREELLRAFGTTGG